MNTYSDVQKNVKVAGGVADANGEVWTNDVSNSEIDLNYLATVNTKFGENIDFRLIAGVNWNQRSYGTRYVVGDGIISRGLYNTDATVTQLSDEYNRLQRFYAAYGDMQFGYKNYLYLGITARNDFSSTLPAANRSYFYPGVNASLSLQTLLISLIIS